MANLTAARVEGLRHELGALPQSALVKADPAAPMCADAPGVTYLARNVSGDEINLRGEYDCLDYVRQDHAYTRTPDVLKGLEDLAHL